MQRLCAHLHAGKGDDRAIGTNGDSLNLAYTARNERGLKRTAVLIQLQKLDMAVCISGSNIKIVCGACTADVASDSHGAVERGQFLGTELTFRIEWKLDNQVVLANRVEKSSRLETGEVVLELLFILRRGEEAFFEKDVGATACTEF
jgi:hypothetical protein